MVKSTGPKSPCGTPIIISYQELREQTVWVLWLRLFS